MGGHCQGAVRPGIYFTLVRNRPSGVSGESANHYTTAIHIADFVKYVNLHHSCLLLLITIDKKCLLIIIQFTSHHTQGQVVCGNYEWVMHNVLD